MVGVIFDTGGPAYPGSMSSRAVSVLYLVSTVLKYVCRRKEAGALVGEGVVGQLFINTDCAYQDQGPRCSEHC